MNLYCHLNSDLDLDFNAIKKLAAFFFVPVSLIFSNINIFSVICGPFS